MTPARFRDVLHTLQWSPPGLSRILTERDQPVSERTIRRWMSGVYPVPDRVGAWLEVLARVHEAHPAPCVLEAWADE